MIENVGVGALELRHDVPTLARATLYNVLEVGQDTTGAVIGAVLYEGEESRHLVVGEGDKMFHKVAHNPFEGGFVALDYDMLIDVLHKAKNLGSKNSLYVKRLKRNVVLHTVKGVLEKQVLGTVIVKFGRSCGLSDSAKVGQCVLLLLVASPKTLKLAVSKRGFDKNGFHIF